MLKDSLSRLIIMTIPSTSATNRVETIIMVKVDSP